MPGRNNREQSDSLIESHKGYDPRLMLFYLITFALLLTLAIGLGYQQLARTGIYSDSERVQNQRRVLVPGPRGNIYDREGRILVGNRPRFATVIYLDELRQEFRREFIRIRKNYREAEDKDMPSSSQMEQIARASVVQNYLDKVNKILGLDLKVDGADLRKHFERQLLLPYTLIDDLEPEQYARLVESLPVTSPLQVYTSSMRHYPYKSAAAHVLGFVSINDDVAAEDFPGEDLRTFKMKGTIGRDGLEKTFDSQLQGEAGGTIFRVDPAGYRINPPLEKRLPVQGKHLTSSLDVDLQIAAEQAIGDQTGSAVALDVRTGEVLVMASKPDYDLSNFAPRLSHAAAADIEARKAWANQAIASFHAPGSTFKILTSIAGMRAGVIGPDTAITDCQGYMRIGGQMVNGRMVGGRLYPCYNGRGHHGHVTLREAIAQSCDIFYYALGLQVTADGLAAEARRFHLDQPTGIELPHESSRATVPDTAWKQRVKPEDEPKWFPGDTANMSIGQGYVLENPLTMACFTASVARGETYTKPTLVHTPNAPRQKSDPIGLTADQYQALIDGMEMVTTTGTAKLITQIPALKIPGVRIAGKTGTAQVRVNQQGKVGTINVAWFICFAPIENPQIAIAVMVEGETIGEEFGGGRQAAPVAAMIMKKYFEKKAVLPANSDLKITASN